MLERLSPLSKVKNTLSASDSPYIPLDDLCSEMDTNRLEYNVTYLICACTFEDPLPITTCDQVVRPLIWRRGSSIPLRYLGPQGGG